MNKCSNRFGIILAAATIALFAGINGLRSQEQASMFADADGLEPPDTGVAYEFPVNVVNVIEQTYVWPELSALLADPDGMNSPNTGFAYDLPVNVVSATEQTYVWPELTALMADPDGMNSPNTGFAYELPVVPTQRTSDVIAERQDATK